MSHSATGIDLESSDYTDPFDLARYKKTFNIYEDLQQSFSRYPMSKKSFYYVRRLWFQALFSFLCIALKCAIYIAFTELT